MGRTGKVVLVLFVLVALFWAGVAAAFAWAVHTVATSPSIEVQVREHGARPARISLHLPAALVVGAVALAPDTVFEGLYGQIGGDIDLERWGPAASELARQLESMPDATLVEVRDGGEQVTVEKRGDELRIRVRSPDADVDVTLPVGLVGRLLVIARPGSTA